MRQHTIQSAFRTGFYWAALIAVYLVIQQLLGLLAMPLVVELGLRENGITSEQARTVRWAFLVAVAITPAFIVYIGARWRRRRQSRARRADTPGQ